MNILPSEQQVLGQYLAIQQPPLVPELSLWLVAGHVDLNARCQELLEGGRAPYWAFCWGSGQAMARHLLDRPEIVRGRRVVDFGAGSGVVGIAAARAGAAEVVAVDTDPTARRFAQRNAELNRVELATSERMPERWDTLLASDVLYEPPLLRWLTRLATRERGVYVSDPQRPGNPRLEQKPLAVFEHARTFPDVDYPMSRALIYRLAEEQRPAYPHIGAAANGDP